MEQETRHTRKISIHPNLYTPIAIVIAGVIISIGIVISGAANRAPSVAGGQPVAPTNLDAAKIKADGNPVVGSKDAPVTMAYWFDYQCPFCEKNETETLSQVVKEYVATGKVRIVFKDFAFLGQDSISLGEAARAVWEVNPGKFYAWHAAVFKNQGQENSGWATAEKIRSITASVLSADETTRVMGLMKSKASAYQAAMDADRSEGAANGVNGTPAMLVGTRMIGGAMPYAQVKAAIDAELAK